MNDTKTKNTTTLAAAAIALSLFAGAALAQSGFDAGDALEALRSAGYAEVRDIEHDDGLWEAEVRGADGRWHDVHVVPGSGEVLDRTRGTLLTAAQVTAAVEAEGYTGIDDLDLDDAVWDLEALSPDGQQVDVRVNGFTGEILVVEIDD